MIKGFHSYDLAIQLYQQCEKLKARAHIQDQLLRASLSVVLNLAEGSGKPTLKEKRRFYGIALGSLRETQALLQVMNQTEASAVANRLGGMLYSLVYPR